MIQGIVMTYSMSNFKAWLKNKPAIKFIVELLFVILPIVFLVRTFVFGLYQVPSGSMETTLLVGERFFADKFTPWITPIKRGEIIAFNEPRYKYSDNMFVNFFQRYIYWNVSNWTKRVIGIPGDHIKLRIEKGHPVVYLNGKKLDEPYVNKYPLILVYKKDGDNTGVLCGPEFEARSFDPDKPYNNQPFYTINPTHIARWIAPNIPYLLIPSTPSPQGIDVQEVTLTKDEYWVMGDNRLNSSDSRVWGTLKGNLIHGRIVFRILSIDTTESWLLLDILKNPLSFWSKIRRSRCLEWVS